jgi:SET family sugar efflux transporter-like MFS transporter
MRNLLQRCRPLYQLREFRVLFVVNLLVGLGHSFVAPFMSMFGTKEAKMNPLVFGVFMTILAVSGIVIATVLSHYSDTRYSRRSMMLLGGIFGVLGYAGFAYFRTFVPLVLVGVFFLGVSSITFSQSFAYAREAISRSAIPQRESVFYMNAFRMFYALAWTVGPAISSWIMVKLSFSAVFLCAALCFLLTVIVVWNAVPEVPPLSAKTADQAQQSLFELFGRWDVFAHFLAFVLIFTSGTIGMMDLPLLVLDVLGGTKEQVGIIYCIAPVFELPFMLYFGLLATKRDTATIIRSGIVIAIVYYGLLIAVRAPWHIYPLQILSAALTAVTSGVAISYFQNYMPDYPGTATNLFMNAMRIGSTVGYLLFGTLAWGFGHRVVFLSCTIFSMLALALMFVPARKSADELKLAA